MTPFIVYSPAGTTKLFRCTCLVEDNGCGFLRFANEVTIQPWQDRCYHDMPVCRVSTPYEQYARAVGDVAEWFGQLGGKAVLCRQITGSFRNFDLSKIIDSYFGMFPDMFCFVFYHPRYNYWMGATPELLVRSTGPHTAATRALAGTRPAGTEQPWDQKNIDEHKLVVADICRCIEAMGPQWKAQPQTTGELPYGNIAHLCTPIDISCNGEAAIDRIARAIHPTPAVGGFPRDAALSAISKYEGTSRAFYGGVLGTETEAYVMLRCVHFDTVNWCVYTGSGITGASRADDEWAETTAKAAPLVNLLNEF